MGSELLEHGGVSELFYWKPSTAYANRPRHALRARMHALPPQLHVYELWAYVRSGFMCSLITFTRVSFNRVRSMHSGVPVPGYHTFFCW